MAEQADNITPIAPERQGENSEAQPLSTDALPPDSDDAALSGNVVFAAHPLSSRQPLFLAPNPDGKHNLIRSDVKPEHCLLVEDSHIEFGTSMVSPEIKPCMTALAELMTKHPKHLVSLFGHADSTGSDAINRVLSGRRALAVYALLIRREKIWLNRLYKQPFHQDDWTVKFAQKILAVIRDGKFKLNWQYGKMDDPTQEAVSQYQAQTPPYDASVPPQLPSPVALPINGELDDVTLLALFKEYMRFLSGEFVLYPSQFLGKGEDAQGRGDYQGCGKFNPILVFSQAETAAYETNHTLRDEQNAANRRVIIYLFNPDIKIALDQWPCPAATDSGGVETCKKYVGPLGEARRAPGTVRRPVDPTDSTFACVKYKHFAEDSPCEEPPVVGLVTYIFLDDATSKGLKGWKVLIKDSKGGSQTKDVVRDDGVVQFQGIAGVTYSVADVWLESSGSIQNAGAMIKATKRAGTP